MVVPPQKNNMQKEGFKLGVWIYYFVIDFYVFLAVLILLCYFIQTTHSNYFIICKFNPHENT